MAPSSPRSVALRRGDLRLPASVHDNALDQFGMIRILFRHIIKRIASRLLRGHTRLAARVGRRYSNRWWLVVEVPAISRRLLYQSATDVSELANYI